jgi:ABC-type branched-subunit amino acid transport system substrate-binding protein
MKRYFLTVATLTAATMLSLSACGSSGTTTGGSDGEDGVKQGVGVTDSTISLATLMDLSGAYAAGGSTLAHAQKAVFDSINADGGICGRKVRLDIRDTGYDVQKTLTQYAQVKDDVLGFPAILGGPMVAALVPSLKRDKTSAVAVTYTSSLLQVPNVMIPGPTSEYWVADGVDWLLQQKLMSKGDKVGLVYFAGDAGVPVLEGAKYAGKAAGIELVSSEVAPTATDFSGVVGNFKREGVSVILVQGTPGVTAGVAGAASAAGLDLPLLTVTGGGFNPGLLSTPAAAYLKKNLRILSPWKMSDSDPKVKTLLATIAKDNPKDTISESTVQGIGIASAYADILRQACDAKDLTRDGVLKAISKASDVDSMGVFVPLDYSKPGITPSRKIYVTKVDESGLAGESLVTEEPFTGDLAANYTP